MSSAIIVLVGIATSPALAMPILVRKASTEFSQSIATRSPRAGPWPSRALAMRLAIRSACAEVTRA
jgi:hypothetical protein